MTELSTQELWQSAPAETELRKAREARAEKHWHPTTPLRSAFVLALVAMNEEPKK